MQWTEMFPWSNQKVKTLDIQIPENIGENVTIIKSVFKEIHGDSTISLLGQNLYLSVDYCTFIGCTSFDTASKAGAIHTALQGFGSVSITRTIADSCASSYEGNFARIEVSTLGSIFVMMTSIDKCAPDKSTQNYHAIQLVLGTHIVSNLNNSRCMAERHAGLSNSVASQGRTEYCNFADNTMTSCLHASDGPIDVRRINYIRNTMTGQFEGYEGLIAAVEGATFSRLIFSDCFMKDNIAKYLISANKVDITLVGCCFDSNEFFTNQGQVIIADPIERPPVTMTLMAGGGKHADIPYGRWWTRSTSNKCQAIIVSLMMALRGD